jgi:hypothetical protein
MQPAVVFHLFCGAGGVGGARGATHAYHHHSFGMHTITMQNPVVVLYASTTAQPSCAWIEVGDDNDA